MRRVVVIGSDHLALRIVELLRAAGCDVAVIAPEGSWLATASLHVEPLLLPRRAEGSGRLRDAGVAAADVLYAVTDRDEMNLGLALAAIEANPRLRVVVRQYNLRLGKLIAAELPQVDVLSASALASPTFAAAALTPGVVFAHDAGRSMLVLRECRASEAAGGTVVAAIVRDRVEWFPETAPAPDATALVATSEGGLPPYPQPDPVSRRARVRFVWPDRIASALHTQRLLLGTLASITIAFAFATLYFETSLGMSPLDATYFVATTITTVGFGDFNLRDADALSKIVGIAVMFSGVTMMALLFAVVTDSVVARHRAAERGRVRLRLKNHVVVCGLGVIGFRVAQALRRLGRHVVVVEVDEGSRFVAPARHEGIPVVIGNALQEDTMRFANLADARALVVCTNLDYLNLEIALHARSLAKRLPIVLRMFDPELSRRVASHFQLRTTFSSAALVASRFAAAATEPTLLASLRFHGQAYEIHRAVAEEARSIASLCDGDRAVAVVDGSGALRFGVDGGTTLEPGEAAIIVKATTGPPSNSIAL